MELNRKTWNQQHAVLRRILMKEKDFSRALPVFLEHHAAIHSAKLGTPWSFQDEVLAPLTEAQIRYVPPADNPSFGSCGTSPGWKT